MPTTCRITRNFFSGYCSIINIICSYWSLLLSNTNLVLWPHCLQRPCVLGCETNVKSRVQVGKYVQGERHPLSPWLFTHTRSSARQVEILGRWRFWPPKKFLHFFYLKCFIKSKFLFIIFFYKALEILINDNNYIFHSL